jgi:hypothetical protein
MGWGLELEHFERGEGFGGSGNLCAEGPAAIGTCAAGAAEVGDYLGATSAERIRGHSITLNTPLVAASICIKLIPTLFMKLDGVVSFLA